MMVTTMPHVLATMTITAAFIFKFAVMHNSTLQLNVTNLPSNMSLADNKAEMQFTSWRQEFRSCPQMWKPALEFFISSDGYPERSRAEVYYSNVWQEINASGVHINFICGNDTLCNCHGPISNVDFCFFRTKFITKENTSCLLEPNCKELFEVVTGNCCAQMFVFCNEISAEDSLGFKTQMKRVQLQVIDSSINKVNGTSASIPTNLIAIVLSTLGLCLMGIALFAVIRRYSNICTKTLRDVDLDSNTFMLSNISNCDPNAAILKTENKYILVIFYPEHYDVTISKFLSELASSTDCKVVTAIQCQDDIATYGVSEWAHDSVQNAHKIVVISSEKAFHKEKLRRKPKVLQKQINLIYKSWKTCSLGGTKNYKSCKAVLPEQHDDLLQRIFLAQWATLVNDQQLKFNYKRVYNIRFHRTESSHVFTEIVPGRHYVLPQNFHQLINDLNS